MGAVLQLERFDPAPEITPVPAAFDQSDLEAAWEGGLAEGRRQAEAQQASQLQDAIQALNARLDAEHAARIEAGAGQVRAIAPLIGALLDGVMPTVARARLEAALLGELLRLAQAVSPLTGRIRCGPDMAAFVAVCLSTAALGGIELDPSGQTGTVEAELLGGLAIWDVGLIGAQLRDLATEMMEVE
jgi:hypothetical protein